MGKLKYSEEQIEDYNKRHGLITPNEARARLRAKGYSEDKIEDEIRVGIACESLLKAMKEYAHRHPEALFEEAEDEEWGCSEDDTSYCD